MTDSDRRIVAVSPVDGRAAQRCLVVDSSMNEYIFEVSTSRLYGPFAPGSSRRYGYWRTVDADSLSALAAEVVTATPSAAEPIQARTQPWRDAGPIASDVGGALWTRAFHPASLDTARPTSSMLFAALREAAGKFPVTVAVHGRQCEREPAFVHFLANSKLMENTDVVWVIPPVGGKPKIETPKLHYLLLDRTKDRHRRIYESAIFDVVLLSGDEEVESLPSDLFVGRTSSLIIEAIGPHSAELLDLYRTKTDLMVMLSYPYSYKVGASDPVLWQATAEPPKYDDLVRCLVYIAQDEISIDVRDNVMMTLRSALGSNKKLVAEVLSAVAKKVDDDPYISHLTEMLVA